MSKDIIIRDIVCQVLVEEKSKALIYSVLNEFIPEYESINLDYTTKPNDDEYKFNTEDEMISCFVDTQNVRQSFYWNKYNNNPDKIMVGANITDDNKIVLSLTFNGTRETEAKHYRRLQEVLNSCIGVISYVNPAEYDNGSDFRIRYENESYKFEE